MLLLTFYTSIKIYRHFSIYVFPNKDDANNVFFSVNRDKTKLPKCLHHFRTTLSRDNTSGTPELCAENVVE